MTNLAPLDLSASQKPAAQASCLPPAVYTSADISAREITSIFRGGWIGVGRADMVPSPGSFITLDVAEQSILLLRDTAGVLRAFANVCRHRGARLVDGSGTCRGIRCPFHSWAYALDGRLVGAPMMEAAQDFKKSDYGLVTYQVEERLGFVFLSVNAGAGKLDAHLGDFAQIHLPWPLDDLMTVRRQVQDVACNWKLFLEVFNEYYHLPFVHPNSIDSAYATPDPADEVRGAFATQFGKTQGSGGLLADDQNKALPAMPGLDPSAANGARYTWVFPNMTFAANHDALWCYEAYPLGPEKCRVVQSACFPAATTVLPNFKDAVDAYLRRMDEALAEDIPALINQQAGLKHPDAKPGRFQPDLEPNVAAFANWYSRKIS